MPAMAGISRFSSCWFPCRIAPPPPRNSSGSRKLKNAALGLRQNMRRSRRYWRQASTDASRTSVARPRALVRLLVCGQFEVKVLQRGPADGELGQRLAARERFGGELV